MYIYNIVLLLDTMFPTENINAVNGTETYLILKHRVD